MIRREDAWEDFYQRCKIVVEQSPYPRPKELEMCFPFITELFNMTVDMINGEYDKIEVDDEVIGKVLK